MRPGIRSLVSTAVAALFVSPPGYDLALAQQVRMYNVQWTNTAPTMDGVIVAGEWAAAAPAQGNWEELRQPESDMDTANNRFQMMWDANGLYLLYQVDQTSWAPAPVGDPNPDINFAGDSLNIYFDPNTDDEQNFLSVPDDMIDGYQVAYDQFEGTIISTNADRKGVGVFTEAHIDAGFGDQAMWNRGGAQISGAAMQDIVIAQNNGATGGIAEIFFPWRNFNADGPVPPTGDYNQNGTVDAADYTQWRDTMGQPVATPGEGADGDLSGTVDQGDYTVWRTNFGVAGEPGESGLYHPFAPSNNDTWFFQLGQITEADPNNTLPVYNYTPADPPLQFFTSHPHAEITFVGRPAAGAAAGVPEPAAVVLAGLAAAGLAAFRRRTR
jgi:hypothetical protein